ncbi:GBF-interacting protein 1-like isoform X2 [Malania oleifera]|uniref:GBF-interacting protein 1-like isoform X2 n=1 Tax=Malania oleifera TaxID=397392 RepID=UPI0025ADE8FD|nr:GBF-interacting protein 1-like isoform X2 [Malania oleifera]
MSSGVRVSIPSSVRKTIQNLKEITGNHSEEEIYAMLKECSMDPNETVQKLLLQDTFHEVKRKRDRRRENLNNKESAESRLRPGMQGRGNRGGRGNYLNRFTSHDAGGSRNSASGKQNGNNQGSEKGVVFSSLPTSQETKNKETNPVASSVAVMANGPVDVTCESTDAVHASHSSARSAGKQPDVTSAVDVSKLGGAPPPPPHMDSNKNTSIGFGSGETHEQPTVSSSNSSASLTPASSSAVCFSSSDPVLVPSHDTRFPGAVGAIKREVGSQRAPVEPNAIAPSESKLAADSEIGSEFMQGKMPGKPQGDGKNQAIESAQPLPSSTHGGSSGRPLSSYSSRSQQVIGSQKGPSKEWKPKPVNPAQGTKTTVASDEVLTTLVEADVHSHPVSSVLDSEAATSEVQKKLEELHFPDRQRLDQQNVIIPNHIHVPESERYKLSFGSIDAWFGISTSYVNGPESDQSSTPRSETSQGIEETVEGQSLSDQNALVSTEEGDYPVHPQSPTHVLENLSSVEGDVSAATAVPEYNEPKQETALPPGGHSHPVVHTSAGYSVGFVPPMLGSQITPVESSESQGRDFTRLPSFVVPQTFDPANYYAQFYRSNVDSDGRISPFHSAGVATKYNGNVAVLSAQTTQSSQEGGNSLVLSTAGPTPLVTQPAGVMQSSMAVTQQPVPVFRQPTGVHISHYPPNYIPYGHYFSPFYVPPPAIHQFLSNGAFPQQPQAGSIYPAPPAAAATGVKYSLPQYKPGNNINNSNPIGMQSGYGLYGSAPANYNPTSAATSGNSTANEDLAASPFKESSVYVTGPQTEGSAVWIAAPGRDIPGLQASSFYNLPPQGQHVTYTPTQAGHGTFAGIYHPAQAVTAANVHPLLQQSQTVAGAADMVGSTAGVFQQPQHAQINWPNSY